MLEQQSYCLFKKRTKKPAFFVHENFFVSMKNNLVLEMLFLLDSVSGFFL